MWPIEAGSDTTTDAKNDRTEPMETNPLTTVNSVRLGAAPPGMAAVRAQERAVRNGRPGPDEDEEARIENERRVDEGLAQANEFRFSVKLFRRDQQA